MLRILTYNIWFSHHQLDRRNAHAVAKNEPHVVCFQEMRHPPFATSRIRSDPPRGARYSGINASSPTTSSTTVHVATSTSSTAKQIAPQLPTRSSALQPHVVRLSRCGRGRRHFDVDANRMVHRLDSWARTNHASGFDREIGGRRLAAIELVGTEPIPPETAEEASRARYYTILVC